MLKTKEDWLAWLALVLMFVAIMLAAGYAGPLELMR